MGVTQREVRQVVREAGLVESHDVRVAPMVLRVTTTTLPGTRREHAAVIAGFAANVLRNVFVATQTERGLPFTIGLVVAGGTILFNVGVALGERAGHDQCLESGGVRPLDK